MWQITSRVRVTYFYIALFHLHGHLKTILLHSLTLPEFPSRSSIQVHTKPYPAQLPRADGIGHPQGGMALLVRRKVQGPACGPVWKPWPHYWNQQMKNFYYPNWDVKSGGDFSFLVLGVLSTFLMGWGVTALKTKEDIFNKIDISCNMVHFCYQLFATRVTTSNND